MHFPSGSTRKTGSVQVSAPDGTLPPAGFIRNRSRDQDNAPRVCQPNAPTARLKRSGSGVSFATGPEQTTRLMAAAFGPVHLKTPLSAPSKDRPVANEPPWLAHIPHTPQQAPAQAHAVNGAHVPTDEMWTAMFGPGPTPTKSPRAGSIASPGTAHDVSTQPTIHPAECNPTPGEQASNLASALFGPLSRPRPGVNMLNASTCFLSATPSPQADHVQPARGAGTTSDTQSVGTDVHRKTSAALQVGPYSRLPPQLKCANTTTSAHALPDHVGLHTDHPSALRASKSCVSHGKTSIPASRTSSQGRASKQAMHNASKSFLTLEKIEELGRNPGCSCSNGATCCLYREDLPERMALAGQIHLLWIKFNGTAKDFHKGQALLDYMYDHQTVSVGSKKKVQFKLAPGAGTNVCPSCWRLCTGFAKENGAESTLYANTRAMFNTGIRRAVQDRVADAPSKLTNAHKNEIKVAVTAFLESWLADNSDPIPEDTAFNDHGPPRVHVDVPRKRDIWLACCEHLERHFDLGLRRNKVKDTEHPAMISMDWFLKLLNRKVNVVIHKHKKFSQCVTCFLFKQLIAKCKNPEDVAEIRAHRRKHFDTVFGERVVYHQCRAWAKENPELALSMILDAQSAWRTRGPTMPREVGSGGFPADFEAFGQQLYGCLVHALPGDDAHKGGFFGYMVDDSVRGGGNVTCEIIYKTLLNLQEQRKVWPPLLDIRLDNTTKDNKNKCVFGFMGWLVLTDVFKTVRVRYLSVGHTHEDIDALFGVLMQHLYRGQCFATIEILMDAIYESFFVTNNKHASGNRPSAKLEHLRATHNWTAWLTTACEEQGLDQANNQKPKPAVSKIEHYARRVPDSHRPHEFVFSKMHIDGIERVVVNYKHWSKDEMYWNKEPIVVFNHAPNLGDLQPALLNPKIIAPLFMCAAAPGFTDNTLFCSAKSGPGDAEGEIKSNSLKNCPRCKVHVAFGTDHKSSAMFTQSDQEAWANRWSNMTQASANDSLTAVRELRTYNRSEPRLPYAMPTCMAEPSLAYLSVEPVTYDGYTEPMYQRLLKQAGVGIAENKFQDDSTVSYAVQEVVGVKSTKKGMLEAAVIWADDTTADGGTWIPLANLNATYHREDEDAGDDDNDAEFRAPFKKAMDIELDQAVARHNWERYFGRDVDEDLDVICGFAQGRNTTAYLGVIVTVDFDEQTGFHHVRFPVAQANSLFGTALNQEADYIDLRLDTLEAVQEVGESDETIRFWVKRDYVGLPFITKHLPSLKVDALPYATKKTTKRRKLLRNMHKLPSSSSSAEDDEPIPGKPRPQPPNQKTKSKSASQYEGLMDKMRRGGLEL